MISYQSTYIFVCYQQKIKKIIIRHSELTYVGYVLFIPDLIDI